MAVAQVRAEHAGVGRRVITDAVRFGSIVHHGEAAPSSSSSHRQRGVHQRGQQQGGEGENGRFHWGVFTVMKNGALAVRWPVVGAEEGSRETCAVVEVATFGIISPRVAHSRGLGHLAAADENALAFDPRLGPDELSVGADDGEALQRAALGHQPAIGVGEREADGLTLHRHGAIDGAGARHGAAIGLGQRLQGQTASHVALGAGMDVLFTRRT